MKDTGTCWVNLGDTYSTISGTMGSDKYVQPKYVVANDAMNFKQPKTDLQNKSLIGIPERFAIAMTDAGWIRRNTIIWYKSNCMPSSANDRFTVDFEYLYFFTKKPQYYFKQQFEPMQQCSIERADRAISGDHKYHAVPGQSTQGIASARKAGQKDYVLNSNGRNKRCVWQLSTEPYPDAHFATYPEKLCEVPIKAGCPKGGTVLDPFMGSGTTLKAARELGRKGIGIEINKEYIEMGIKRMKLNQALLFNR